MVYNKIKLTILGKNYVIQTNEEESYLMGIAKMLEQKITKLADSNDSMTTSTATILTCLDLLDETYKLSSDLDNIRTQVSGYVEEANRARAELDKLRSEIAERNSEVEKLKTDIKLLTLKGTLD